MSGIVGSYFNTRGSGVVAKLGTDGQVFTSSGAGVSQDFEAAAGGGAWNHLVTTTASGDSEIEFDTTYFTSSYKVYKILISNLHCSDAGPGTELYCQFKHGGSYVTSGYSFAAFRIIQTSTSAYNGAASDGSASQIQITADNLGGDTGETSCWEMTLDDPLGTDNDKVLWGMAGSVNHDNRYSRETFIGGSELSTAIDAIKFYMEGGDFSSGRFSVYGITT